MSIEHRILIVGNICKDVIYTTAEYPAEDSKSKALSKNIRLGGNAANVCLALSQFSNTDVTCCIKIGDCDYSQDLVSRFKSIGVEPIPVVEKSSSIPESIIIHSNKTSSRTCFHYRGECNDLTSNQVIERVGDFRKYDWIHLEHRRNGNDVLLLAQYIKQNAPNVIISLEIEKIRDGFKEIIQIVDYPIISKEVCMEFGYDNIVTALKNFSPMVSYAVIVTWAEHGAGIWTKDRKQLENIDSGKLHVVGDKMLHCEAFKVDNIVDTIGAGDTFTAGLIDTMLKTGSIPAAILRACKLASLKLQVSGMHLNLQPEDTL